MAFDLMKTEKIKVRINKCQSELMIPRLNNESPIPFLSPEIHIIKVKNTQIVPIQRKCGQNGDSKMNLISILFSRSPRVKCAL